jgi:predicted PurR-regulated permease PerM
MLRIGMTTAAVLVALWVAYIARGALFPFALGAAIAFVISPLVERLARIQPWYERRPELARGVAILTVYVSVSAALVVAGFLFIPQLVDEVDQLVEDVPDLTRKARDEFSAWNQQYEERVPADLRERIDKSFREVGNDVSAAARAIAVRSLNVVVSTLATVLGFISVPFFVFYALKDREKAFGRFYSWFPAHLQPDVKEVVRIGNRTLGAYVRAQLFLALVIFVITYAGLWLMGVEFSLGLAFVAGLTEMIPIIGPLIGFVPAFVVVLATEPEHWWWVVLFYLGVQAVENYLLVPRIHANSVQMHPALVLVLLAVGGALWGLWGVLVIVPLAAALRDVFTYIYGRLGEAEERRRKLDVDVDRPG